MGHTRAESCSGIEPHATRQLEASDDDYFLVANAKIVLGRNKQGSSMLHALFEDDGTLSARAAGSGFTGPSGVPGSPWSR